MMGRYRHQKYTYSNQFGNPRHQWEVIGPRGALHFHATFFKNQHEPSCGLEIHYMTPPHYMRDEAPSQMRCWLLNCPCWHDGTSLYASEHLWPLIEMYLRDSIHEAVFRILEREADERFGHREEAEESESASAMSAGTAETAEQAQGRSPASATAEGRDAQPLPSDPKEQSRG